MNFATPHYINELHSDIRGIKNGWYTMEDDGKLLSGPFATREECMSLDQTGIDGVRLDAASVIVERRE